MIYPSENKLFMPQALDVLPETATSQASVVFNHIFRLDKVQKPEFKPFTYAEQLGCDTHLGVTGAGLRSGFRGEAGSCDTWLVHGN